MKVLVTPVYGYGWYGASGPPALEVPQEFSFDVEVLEPGPPFEIAVGLVAEQDHPLTGLWVVLQIRTRGSQPAYNLIAYAEKPIPNEKREPVLTGFAKAVPISN